MVRDPWTIPFCGTTYVCWKDQTGPQHRPLELSEETAYFRSQNKEKFLYDLLNSGR